MRLVALLLTVLISLPQSSFAACLNPTGTKGEITYNADSNVPQYCDGANWIAMVGQAPELTGPQNCSSIGDTCTDGSIYAGDSPDGNVAMYTTPADAPSTYTWNDGSGFSNDLAMDNCTDASPGTAATCQTGEANTAFLVGATGEPDYPFAAAEYCDGLSAHGYDDWYLPALDELNVLYTNKNTGDLNGTFDESGSFPAGYYWSSSEGASDSIARSQRFSDGDQDTGYDFKSDFLVVRCVRSHQSGEGQSQLTQIVPNGLIGHWRFDETSGTTAADSSGNGNGATMQNALDASSDSVAGKMGNALRFNYPTNANEWAETADVATFGGLTAMSYSMWVKLDRLDGHKGLFEIPGVALARLNWDNGNLRFIAEGWSVNFGHWYPSYGPLDAVVDEWQHIVVTYDYNDPIGTDPTFYINGVAVDSGSIFELGTPDGTYTPPATAKVDIGVESSREFKGAIDDFRIYSRVLSAAEVQEIYQARDGIRYNNAHRVPEFFDGNKFVPMTPAFPDVTDGLIGHWKLDETIGTTATDSTGNMDVDRFSNYSDFSIHSVPGAIGRAFDGHAYIYNGFNDTPYPASYVDTGSLTISAWVNLKDATGNSAVFGMEDYVQLWKQHDQPNVRLEVQAWATNGQANAGFTLPLDEWSHVAVTYDYNAPQGTLPKFYINGVYDNAANWAISPAGSYTAPTPGVITLGRRWDSSASSFKGYVDDIRYYNRELSEAEIQSLYRMGRPYLTSTALPQGCSNIGDACDDGAFYAGLSPDGSVEMFMTNVSYEISSTPWNNGASNHTVTNAISTTDGDGNTLTAVSSDSDSVAAGLQHHDAAQYCYSLIAHSADDWYLPAREELLLIYNGGSHVGDINTSARYWSSTEQGGVTARNVNMPDGSVGNGNKNNDLFVRCVRKGPAPRCASPYGLEGALLYNDDHSVVQYCDGARWIAIGKRQ